jgi:arylsulfatase A-like enzyme
VVITDDQRATETLGVMQVTRRLFLKKGRRFTNAFATTPVCCPARASIFTGQYAHNHGVRRNGEMGTMKQEYTVQRYLKEAGYRTGIFGKYGNGWNRRRNPPYFDRWAIFSTSSNHYRDGDWNVDGTIRTIDAYASEYIKRRAVKFIRHGEVADRDPWLLFLNPPAPHHPSTPQPAYANRLYPTWPGNPAVRERSTRDKPPYVRRAPPKTLDDGRAIRLRNLRALESVDDMTRRVFTALRRQGENRRTLAIFMSDNGFMWAEHKLTSKYHAYTKSIQIPLAMRWPGKVRRGGTSRKLVANIDVAPTIMDAARIDSHHLMDGRSLLRSWKRSTLLHEQWKVRTSSVPTWKSLRTRRMQYIEYFDSEGNRTFREYYNLRRDPWQRSNLLRDGSNRSGPGRKRLRALHQRLEATAHCSGTGCR